ncbi:MAG TPA: hypothetical protein VGO62_19930 [Myxococcota bacterium]|jgi:hypothetical protein
MAVSAVSPASAGVVDRGGGASIRDQIRAQERTHGDREKAQLAACPDDASRAALKKEFTAARAERAEKYAAMLCSVDGWEPKASASPQSKVLTAFYALAGQKARALAAKQHRPFAMGDLHKVKLSEKDVEKLRRQFGDDAVKKAWPLLKKHICHEGFLSKAALKFMQSARFIAFQSALLLAQDHMERGIHQTDVKLDEKDAALLRETLRLEQKRGVTLVFTDQHTRADGVREDALYTSVGGHLVRIKKDG